MFKKISSKLMIGAIIMLSAHTAYAMPIVEGHRADQQIINQQQEEIYKLIAKEDAYVRDVSYANDNFGQATVIEAKLPQASSTPGYRREAFIKFDLSEYPKEYIESAKIGLTLTGFHGSANNDSVQIFKTTNDWVEDTLTWNNRPNKNTAVPPAQDKITQVVIGDKQSTTYPKLVELDVTDYVNEKLQTGEAELSILVSYDQLDNSGQLGWKIASKEHDLEKRPYLEITASQGIPAPTITITGVEDKEVTFDSTKTINVSATSVDSSVTFNQTVWLNGEEVTGNNGSYTVNLQEGSNLIKVSVIDSTGNEVTREFNVHRSFVEEVTYYVDAEAGNDQADGLTPQSAFKSLDKLNSMIFNPGNKILFKKGSVWNGQFRPQGSGVEGYPIVVDTYGEGSRPIINGMGVSNKELGKVITQGAVHLYNVSYWELNNLEVTNFKQGTPASDERRAGIMVNGGGNAEPITHIYIRDCYVHSVNSHRDAFKHTGGIIFYGDSQTDEGVEKGISEGFHDILVENNHIKDVAIEGLRTKTNEKPGTNYPGKVRKNQNITFRNNLIQDIWGDGIVISEVEGGLVEKNTIQRHSQTPNTSAYYAGCWTWNVKDVYLQYNDVSEGKNGGGDGEAFDIDRFCENVVIQYNYSHYNNGGAVLFMPELYEGNEYRYNVSYNDGAPGRKIIQHLPGQRGYIVDKLPAIYNNSFYVGEGRTVGSFVETYYGDGRMNFYNNIVQIDGTLNRFAGASLGQTTGTFKNNIMYPGSIASLPGNPGVQQNLITEDPKFVNINKPVLNMGFWDQEIWDANIERFKVAPDSPAINAGTNDQITARADIYGTPLVDGRIDIGAHEFVAESIAPKVTLEGNKQVIGGKELEIVLGIESTTSSVYALDFTINFDETVFDFVEAVGIGNSQEVDTKVEAGKARVLLMTEGGATSGEPIATLKFKAKNVNNTVQSTIALSDTTFGTVENGIAEVVVAEGSSSVITITPAPVIIDKTELVNTISEAQRLSDGATVGNEIGQYPQDAKDALDAAIAQVNNVLNTSEDQTVINEAVTVLREAINKFKGAVIKPAVEDINEDGKVDVADLALVAYYYQKAAGQDGWDEAIKADIDNDGKVDIADLSKVASKILNK